MNNIDFPMAEVSIDQLIVPEEVDASTLNSFSYSFDELKKNLLEYLEPYRNIEVTEETLKGCKQTQKEIASKRKKLETIRKEVKKRFTEPLIGFENQIKELVSEIDKAEESLNRGIKHFDDQRRMQKKEIALSIIAEERERFGLNEKFGSMIVLEPKYTNLTATEKQVRESVEMQCEVLLEKQRAEEASVKVIRNLVNAENKTLTAKIGAEEFVSMLRIADLDEITRRIAERASYVRKCESAPDSSENEESVKEETNNSTSVAEDLTEADEDIYRVTFVITAKASKQKMLSEFLKANGFMYEVEQQIIL